MKRMTDGDKVEKASAMSEEMTVVRKVKPPNGIDARLNCLVAVDGEYPVAATLAAELIASGEYVAASAEKTERIATCHTE